MDTKVLKYLLDIESIIQEIESIVARSDNNFEVFSADFLLKRAAERDLEIIGEAINKMMKLKPNLNISGIKKIIGLRNLIIHAYDSIEDELIWGIMLKDIPVLKKEIEQLKN